MNKVSLIICLIAVCMACESNKEELRQNLPARTVDSMAVESFGVRLLFSDSARVTAELYATHIMEVQDKNVFGEEDLTLFKKHVAQAVERVMTTDKAEEDFTARIMQEAHRTFPWPEVSKEEGEDLKKRANTPVANIKPRTLHYMEDSIHIDFLDRYGRAHSFIESESAIYSRDDDWAVLIENVILKNQQGDKLETAQLFWDKDVDSIYTHTPVQITTPDKIITGSKGMRSTSSFDSYIIFGTYGEVSLNAVEGESTETPPAPRAPTRPARMEQPKVIK